MNRRRRPPLTRREIQLLLLIGLVTTVVLVVLIGADIRLSSLASGGGGFFAAWQGLRAFIWEHADPYGAPTAAASQLLAYQHSATPGQNPYVLTTPFFLLPFYLPLALIADPATARGLWTFVGQSALIGTALLSVALSGWQPSRILLALYCLPAVFGFYPIMALLDGSPAIMLGLIYAASLWAYSIGQDELAGALLVLALFSWEVGSVFLLLFAWRIFHDRRWRVLGGFSMTLTVLLGISFLMYPGWVLPYLTATLAVARTSFGFTTTSILVRSFPASGARMAQGIAVLVVCLLVYEWAAGRGSDIRRFVWTACVALAATPLLGFRVEMSQLVVLFPAFSLVCAAAVGRERIHSWFAASILTLVLVLPWALLIRGSAPPDERASDFLFLFYPTIILASLYWTRWWFLRPQRTWLDQVRDLKT